MKRILFPIGLLAVLAFGVACNSPADKGKKAALKECECHKIENGNEKMKCINAALDEYNMLLREYSGDTAAYQEIKKAYETHRSTCSE